MTTFRTGQDVAVVEHDPATRKPLDRGRRLFTTISYVNDVYVQIDGTETYRIGCPPVAYDAGSGWDLRITEYRWRLVPLCHRCERPVTGTPVTDEGDPMHRTWCSGDCHDDDGEAYDAAQLRGM